MRVVALFASVVLITFGLATSGWAENKAETSVAERSLDELLAELQQQTESIGARVAELEALDRPITGDELDYLQKAADELREARRQVEDALPPEVERPAEIDQSSELLHRMEMLAQESQPVRTAPEEPLFAPVLDALKAVQFYGSLRGRLRATGDEPTEFDENTSRV